MGANTAIEWADATWNPIRGCTRVSEGCRYCYAEGLAARFSGPGQPFEGLAAMVTGKDGHRPRWTGKIAWAPNVLLEPVKWQQPRTIFVNSMSDLFHEAVLVEHIDQIIAVMALAPRHVFIVLTKRPDVMRRYLSDPAMPERVRAQLLTPAPDSPLDKAGKGEKPRVTAVEIIAAAQAISAGPLHNLWLGTSVENQEAADARIPELLETPAAKHIVSAEPLLGPINFNLIDPTYVKGKLSSFTQALPDPNDPCEKNHLDWVISGGESGLGGRPMHPDWARSIRDQCVAADVPFFFKQWGAWANAGVAGAGVANDNRTAHAWPDGTEMRLVGKKKAGHLLDGRVWQQTPPMPRLPAKPAKEVAA